MKKTKKTATQNTPAVGPPDWDCRRFSVGYTTVVWVPGMTRYYPTPEGKKRPIKIEFVSWAGFAPGAVHTHVSITPEKNPVWADDHWVELREDPEEARDRDLQLNQGFVNPARALRWAVRTLEQKFPESEWQHDWPGQEWDDDDNPLPRRWDPANVQPDPAEDAAVAPCELCKFAVGEHTPEQAESCRKYLSIEPARVSMFVPPKPVCKTLVDAGSVTGTVGDDVLVLTDMHPSQVELLSRARALIVERGGATAHLATVAREMGVTVMLVPDAVTRYPEGTNVDIDPVSGTVTPW